MKNKQVYDENKPQYSSLWERALSNKRSRYHKMPIDSDMNCIRHSERIKGPDGTICWKHSYIRQDGLKKKGSTRYYRKTQDEWGSNVTIEVDSNGNEIKKRR